jgi:hypothetical protein
MNVYSKIFLKYDFLSFGSPSAARCPTAAYAGRAHKSAIKLEGGDELFLISRVT